MSWASPIIAIALMFGVLAGVLTWVAGPSKGIFTVGKAGYLPPFFKRPTNPAYSATSCSSKDASLRY